VRQFVREAPATAFFLVLWLAVFVAMAVQQGGLQTGGDFLTGGISPETGNVFGSQTSRQLYAGQLWRALTATWIHYSIIHLLGNMWVMYQIGPLVEGWYGSGLFLGLCVALGWLGNLVAGLAKPWIAMLLRGWTTIPDYSAGGASGLVCGLIALVAVVGWRSRTRFGDFIRGQMVAFLAYVAIMGVVLPNIDNFGHAGGALVGAVAGFLHRPMVRAARSRGSAVAGVLGLAALAGCGAAQYRTARAEPPTAPAVSAASQLQETFGRAVLAWRQLEVIDVLYRSLAAGTPPRGEMAGGSRGAVVPPRAVLVQDLKQALARLEVVRMSVRTPEEAAALGSLQRAIGGLGERRPAPGEVVAFQRSLETLKRRAFADVRDSGQALSRVLRKGQAVPAAPR
jgi:membrane associated rhomboid family serine protease